MAKYKIRCGRCKKNYFIPSGKGFQVCYDCQVNELKGEITDPAMKEMFDIPEDHYKQNAFLRDIKVKYLRYGELTVNQIEAFKKTVGEMAKE